MLSKKGQVGDTVTWVVATVIIVVLLIFFIFGTSLLADAKKVTEVGNKVLPADLLQKKDLFLEYSVFTYFKINDVSERDSLLGYISRLEEKGFFFESLEDKKKEIGDGLQ